MTFAEDRLNDMAKAALKAVPPLQVDARDGVDALCLPFNHEFGMLMMMMMMMMMIVKLMLIVLFNGNSMQW